MTETPPTADDVVAAQRKIAPHVRRTPLLRVTVDGRELVLKLEQLQRTGSFKLRGAVNAIMSEPTPPRQVVTASGGNHGLAVATAARLLGVPATVYVPESVPEAKAAWIAKTGASLVRQGKTYADAAAVAQRASAGDGVRYVHA
ncbi:MAG: pyridoxal-phosphate dependent enzyme, partial [Sciscionella sp.]|nr:pyridoxal-phosphate dependent enzyme [Sciscionella sp.]